MSAGVPEQRGTHAGDSSVGHLRILVVASFEDSELSEQSMVTRALLNLGHTVVPVDCSIDRRCSNDRILEVVSSEVHALSLRLAPDVVLVFGRELRSCLGGRADWAEAVSGVTCVLDVDISGAALTFLEFGTSVVVGSIDVGFDEAMIRRSPLDRRNETSDLLITFVDDHGESKEVCSAPRLAIISPLVRSNWGSDEYLRLLSERRRYALDSDLDDYWRARFRADIALADMVYGLSDATVLDYEHELSELVDVLRTHGGLIRDQGSRAPDSLVMFQGYFGADNLGDELLLDTVLSRLERNCGEIVPVICCWRISERLLSYGVPLVESSNFVRRRFWASLASVVVVGPGGLWTDYSVRRANGVAALTGAGEFSIPLSVGYLLDGTAYGAIRAALGLGAIPLRTIEARALVRVAAALLDRAWVRDGASAKAIIDCGGPIPTVTPDLAFAAELPRPHKPEEPRIIVNVREWFDTADGFLEELGATLGEHARKLGADLVFVPMAPEDCSPLVLLSRYVGDGVRITYVAPKSSVEDVASLISGSSLVVSMRLHLCLLGLRMGVPTVGLQYDDKVRELFSSLDATRALVPLSSGVNAPLLAALRFAEEYGRTGGAERVHALERKASAALDDFCGYLAESPLSAGRLVIERDLSPNHFARDRNNSVNVTRVGLLAALSTFGLNAENGTPVTFDAAWQKGGSARSVRMTASAPRRGDCVGMRLALGACETARRARIDAELHYRGDGHNTGRLAFFIELDGVLRMACDLANWEGKVRIDLGLTPGSPHTVRIGVLALVDCEDWSWGQASRCDVTGIQLSDEGVSLEPGSGWNIPPVLAMPCEGLTLETFLVAGVSRSPWVLMRRTGRALVNKTRAAKRAFSRMVVRS